MKYKVDLEKLKRQLNHVYPIWREKLPLFFPYAHSELYRNPIPEMIILLGAAFGLVAQDLVDQIMEMAKKQAESDQDTEGEGKCKKCKGAGLQSENSSTSKSKTKTNSKSESENSSDSEAKDSKDKNSKDKLSKSKKCPSCNGTGQKSERDNPLKPATYSVDEMRKDFLDGLVSKNQGTHLEDLSKNSLSYMYSDTGDYSYTQRKLKGVKPTVDFALSNLFKKRLLAEARNKTVSNLEEGELDGHELIGAYSGRRDVFERYERGKSNKIAFVIALDHSGSMSCGPTKNSPDYKQAVAAVNIISALDKLKIPNCILSFGDEVRYIRMFGDTSEWCPPQGFTGYEVPQQCYKRAVEILKERRDKRKILLLLSDGALWPKHCRAHRKLAIRHKIETYAFGIGFSYEEKSKEHRQVMEIYDNIVYHKRNSSESLEESLYQYMDDLFQDRFRKYK